MDLNNSRSWNSSSDLEDPELTQQTEDKSNLDQPLIETEFCVDDISSQNSDNENSPSKSKL